MKRFHFIWILLCVFSLSAQEVRWEAREEIRALVPDSPRPLKMESDLALKTALILEGVPVESRRVYEEKIDSLVQGFLGSNPDAPPPEIMGDRLLQFLHEKVIKKYVSHQTRVSTALDQGTFNCVSSALLYGILGSKLGLKIHYVGTRDHAFCVLTTDTRLVDVETTTSLGFDPGKKREFQDEFGRITGFSYVPPGQYRTRETHEFPGILGLLIQNLVAERQAAGDVITPLGLAWDRHYLEATPESSDFLLQVFSNLAAHRNGKKEYLKGLEEIRRMASLVEAEDRLDVLGKSMANNGLVQLFDAQNWGAAWKFLKEWKDYLGNLESQWMTNLNAGQAKALYTSKGLEALFLWTETVTPEQMTEEQRISLEETFVLQSMAPLMNRRNWTEAEKVLVKLPVRLVTRPKIITLKDTLTYNRTVEVHNQFAALMNKREFEAARALLQKAAEAYPDSQLLQKDLLLLQKALGNSSQP